VANIANVQGSNLSGTSAWYVLGAPAGCVANVSLSGGTGDSFTVWDSTGQQIITGTGGGGPVGFGISGQPHYPYYIDVSGGTSGVTFTLTIGVVV
jgi:hypothetical protein